MAHKQLADGRVVVDWTTGDPEGDRIHLLKAYSDFIDEIGETILLNYGKVELSEELGKVFVKWKVSTADQVDEVPRIWIERP